MAPLIGNDPCTVYRREYTTPGTERDADGYIMDDDSEITVTVHLNVNMTPLPATGKDTERLPEGDRTGDHAKFLSKKWDFRAVDTDTRQLADHVLWEGSRYEIIQTKYYPKVHRHYEAIGRRIGE